MGSHPHKWRNHTTCETFDREMGCVISQGTLSSKTNALSIKMSLVRAERKSSPFLNLQRGQTIIATQLNHTVNRKLTLFKVHGVLWIGCPHLIQSPTLPSVCPVVFARNTGYDRVSARKCASTTESMQHLMTTSVYFKTRFLPDDEQSDQF